MFYQDEGGLRATDECNEPMDVIYYLGVIDICTPYSFVKKVEHMWKSFTEDRVSLRFLIVSVWTVGNSRVIARAMNRTKLEADFSLPLPFLFGPSLSQHGISAVPPNEYGERFLNFLLSCLPNSDPELRPAGLRSKDIKPLPDVPEGEQVPINGTLPPPNGPTDEVENNEHIFAKKEKPKYKAE